MTRRSFFDRLGKLAIGTVAFNILPPATTYRRIWRAEVSLVNPEWVNATYEVFFLSNNAFGLINFSDWHRWKPTV